MRHGMFGLILLGAVMAAEAAPADPMPGTYRCLSYNVSGGGGSCSTFQPLVLRPDGTYQYSSTIGVWRTQGGQLHLSASSLWGAGQVLGPDTIRFQYDYRGWRHTVTWTCADCGQHRGALLPPPGAAGAAGEASAGVSLVLEFGARVNGASTFVIVPAEAARAYAHNAPLPTGAVSGLAWNHSPTAIALATGRGNALRTGRTYVVFLSWPRESIPVAVLDLPTVSSDYAATLRATLDGNAVLSAVGMAPAPVSEAPPGPGDALPPDMPPGSSAPPPSGGAAGLEEFVRAMTELFRGLDGLRQRERKGDPPATAAPPPPGPEQPGPATGPASYPPAFTPDAAPPPPPPDPTAGPPAPFPTASSPPPAAAPRCNPLIPKYSQPGCVE